jgi:8-oxo-dGTP pyrophosphatase MutT (NUDIX family)
VIRQVEDGWRVLLLRVYNYWDCPKGVVEPGEDPLATARREVREETGIADLEFRWGERFIETPPYSKNKVARYYLAATHAVDVKLPVNPELGAPEHHDAVRSPVALPSRSRGNRRRPPCRRRATQP